MYKSQLQLYFCNDGRKKKRNGFWECELAGTPVNHKAKSLPQEARDGKQNGQFINLDWWKDQPISTLKTTGFFSIQIRKQH